MTAAMLLLHGYSITALVMFHVIDLTIFFSLSLDLKKGPCNPNPKEDQLKPFEPVERLRRMLAHDVENNVTFFIVGFLYVVLGVGCDNAMKSYTIFKFAHHFAYVTGQSREVRFLLWSLTSLSFVTICVQMVYFVLSYHSKDPEVEAISHSTL
jgi:hypothetical protein